MKKLEILNLELKCEETFLFLCTVDLIMHLCCNSFNIVKPNIRNWMNNKKESSFWVLSFLNFC